MARRKKNTYISPAEQADILVVNALAGFQTAYNSILEANTILADSVASDQALISSLESKVDDAKTAIAGNKKFLTKLADFVPGA